MHQVTGADGRRPHAIAAPGVVQLQEGGPKHIAARRNGRQYELGRGYAGLLGMRYQVIALCGTVWGCARQSELALCVVDQAGTERCIKRSFSFNAAINWSSSQDMVSSSYSARAAPRLNGTGAPASSV